MVITNSSALKNSLETELQKCGREIGELVGLDEDNDVGIRLPFIKDGKVSYASFEFKTNPEKAGKIIKELPEKWQTRQGRMIIEDDDYRVTTENCLAVTYFCVIKLVPYKTRGIQELLENSRQLTRYFRSIIKQLQDSRKYKH